MHLTFDLTQDDIMAYQLYHYAHSPAARRQKWTGAVWVVILGLMVWVIPVFLTGSFGQSARTWWPFLLVAPLSLSLFLLRWKSILRRNIERMIAEGSNRALLGRKEVTITPVEITAAGELRSTTVRWKAVERIEVADEYAYVYFSALEAVILPRRAFAGEAEFAAWVETARKHQAQALA